MSTALIRKARRQALQAIRELKHIDRRLTELGCLNAHIHFKRRLNRHGESVITNMMYLLEPQDRITRKRRYTYIGVDRGRQDDALERMERFKTRQRLRARIAGLKHTFRRADNELTATLATYRALARQARDCAREFAPQAQRLSRWNASLQAGTKPILPETLFMPDGTPDSLVTATIDSLPPAKSTIIPNRRRK